MVCLCLVGRQLVIKILEHFPYLLGDFIGILGSYIFLSHVENILLKLGTGLAQTWKVLEFDCGPGKLLEFENSVFCPGIVLEFCKIVLENMN